MVSSWYNVMDAEPGFTKEALTTLQVNVLARERDGQEVVCTLMICLYASMPSGMVRQGSTPGLLTMARMSTTTTRCQKLQAY